ncbi:hypothetical protein [Solibacillus sp. FSL W7-1324]|uniref:hypothetical protein n=1 Tax=Solibacillus sp. FSL W7-1324 TaxID=2921701 RepID=UPI0030FAE91D
MENSESFFTKISAFDVNKIKAGKSFELYIPADDFDTSKICNCIVKQVSAFEITLLVAELEMKPDGYEYEFRFRTYHIDDFSEHRGYKLSALYNEDEWNKRIKKL